MIRAVAIALLTLLLATTACTPKSVPAAPSPSPEAASLPAEKKLARVSRFRPEVVARRHRELPWNAVAEGFSLFAYDAIQTRQAASASLDLVNGSKLDLSENALVILTPSLVDRAVVRRGNLTAETTGELWILTSAALLRLAPEKPGRKARAQVVLKEGSHLRVELAEGKGVLERDKQPPIAVVAGNSSTVPAPEAEETFGYGSPASWESALSPVDQAHTTATQAAARAIAAIAPKGELTISYPEDYAQLDSDFVVLKGKVSGGKPTVLVNGKSARVEKSGTFELKVALHPGRNPLSVQEIQTDGTASFRFLTILRK
jgi:hypothetical protein